MNPYIQDLISAIKLKDTNRAIAISKQIKELITKNDLNLVNAVVDPAGITAMHAALTEHLQVPHRLLLMKRKAMTRTTKAYMFMSIIENALTRISK